MKKLLRLLFSTAWRVLLVGAICIAMIVVVFSLPEVADYKSAPLKVWLIFVPAVLVAALGPLLLFRR
ncbi:hypothetical protein OS190_13615 [Sulfitobacter sp. F26204]|uniref:hypothetical protein n=1 Tax=Sulfitobacter sp. F26204 TaxID=2996014 RepID=UPI00225E528C|nr:hypothetical protein [Sulfitobacter sp. F26204]MCX7560610.1 hypothetical protein [Sulfitobacter sp. F26204]